MSAKLTWFLDMASNFRIPLLIISLFFWLGYFVTFSILASVFLCMALLCSLFALLPLSSWVGSVPKIDNASLEITTFNIQWNIDQHKACLDFIRKLSSDIVILQEVTEATRTEINTWRDEFPYQFGDGHSHTMVIAKRPILEKKYLSWPGKFDNRAIHFSVQEQEQELHIIGIHLQVTRSSQELTPREEQISTLITCSRELVNKPLMIVGDFNAATGSRVLNRILRECELQVVNSLLRYQPTWPSKLKQFGIQIDQFLVSRHFYLEQIKLGPMTESDHRPLTARFSIKTLG